MIKAVIFDYGGVFSSGGRGNIPRYRLTQLLNQDSDTSLAISKKYWHPLQRGLVNESDFWTGIEEDNDQLIPHEQRNIWNHWDVMAPYPEMVEFIKKLKKQGLVIGMISNIVPFTEAIIRKHGGYELFDPCILSCKVGFAKPETEIYQQLLDALPDIEPSEMLYIDDQGLCLEPARVLGMHVVLADSAEQTIQDITATLQEQS